MDDKTKNEMDESASQSADRTGNSEFFIDDYSHLRLSYYQYRGNNISHNMSYTDMNQDSAYSTNASTDKSFTFTNTSTDKIEDVLDPNNEPANSSNAANTSTNSTALSEEERRKLREFYISQIPDLPHPSYTVASIIASASHRMNPKNCFVYNKRIEQGNQRGEHLEMETFDPQHRSTLTPDTKL